MFDTKKFLTDNWPSPNDMHAWLLSFEPGLKPINVYMWYRRETLPAPWFARILAYMELTRGEPVSLLPWLKKSRKRWP